MDRHWARIVALVACCMALQRAQPAGADETPILRMNTASNPAYAAVGEQITYQAWVYSTSDITETMYITATVEPYQRLAVAGTVVDNAMGPAVCQPTLYHLACQINIKRWYPASVFGVIDAPLLASCDQRVSLRVKADLPNRHSEEVITTRITSGTRCYYFPFVGG